VIWSDIHRAWINEQIIQIFCGREHAGNIDIDGVIVLKLILNKQGILYGLDLSGWLQGPVSGFREYGNEPFQFDKVREITYQMRRFRLSKEDPTS
jgi:hypothetical protein